MIRTVLFDIGGVLELVDDANWPQEWFAHWTGELGIDPVEARERIAEEEPPDTGVTVGTEPAYRAAFGRALGLTQEQNDRMFADMWDRYCGTANQPMIDFARSLRGRVQVAILSNSGDGARREEERRYGFSEIFDPILYSHELGVEKPDPAVFRLAAQRCGTAPAQILFLDDNPVNVEGARSVGMRAHLHRDNAGTFALVEDLLGGREA